MRASYLTLPEIGAVFYWKIRKFLAGSENAASLGLPIGLEFKGVNDNEHKYHMGATGG